MGASDYEQIVTEKCRLGSDPENPPADGAGEERRERRQTSAR
jgi:hypothetical protein